MNSAEGEIVTEESFPYGVRCYICRHEILNGYPFYSIANLGDCWLTDQGVHSNAHVIVCGECLPEPECSTDMEELELCITVKGNDVNTKVRMLVEDSDDGIDLTTTNYDIEVKSIARADGLPFAVDEDFEVWWNTTKTNWTGSPASKDVARKAYYAGRKLLK